MPQDSQPPRRVLPPVYFLLSLLLMVVLHAVLPIAHIVSGPIRYLGILLVLIGVSTALWARRLFARAGTTIKPFQESTDLVLEGPFRISRNPMYLSMILVLIGTALLLGSLSPWFVVPILALILDRRFIRAEERMLEHTFGESYRSYQSHVRRWL